MPAFSVRSHPNERRICRIEISRIHVSPYQPRRSMNEADLHSLAESIRRFGLLSPLLVRRTNDDFELIAGERRLRALQLLGEDRADVIITGAFDRDCALMALAENLQRENLHFLDAAEACRRILREHGLTQDELAAGIAKSPSALANLLRLLRLNRETRSIIRESGLSERHARALLKLKDEPLQLDFARRAASEKLSVRQLEGLIDQHLRQKSAPPRLPNALLQDQRLVINALKDTVRRLRHIGVPASSRIEAHEDHYDIIVTIRTAK